MIELRHMADYRELSDGLEELALEYSELDPEDIFRGIGAGVYLPFDVFRDGEPCAQVIFQILEHPRCLFFLYLHGGGFLLTGEGLAFTQNLATAWGCVDDEGDPMMRFQSQRRTWDRVARRFGFEPVSTNYRYVGA